MDFAYGYGLRQYRLRRVSYIFSRAKPTLRQPIADTRKSSEKTPHIPAYLAVIPAQAGIQTYGFQKYSTMDVAWTLPTDMVYDNIGCGGSLIYSRGRSPRYGSRLQIPASRLKKTHSTSLPATPSFLRRRESKPLIFRNIQRLPQYGLCPRMQFAEILVSAGRLCFTGETRHIFRRRF